MLRVESEAAVGALALSVGLEIAPGQCLALAGPSGAGKTSVLRIVAGLLRPRRGLVRCGEETWLDTARDLAVPTERRRVGYVFQDYALFAHLRAWQNVAYGMADLPRRERRDRAHELLERFGVGHLADARPRRLSGGERQRVALARALARRPAALLLDEPLAALDPRTRARAGRELAALLRETAAPALLVTHDFAEAALLGDRVAVLDGGRVVQEGTAAELAASPASAFVADLTGAAVLLGEARPGEGGTTIVELEGGGTVTSLDAGAGPVAVSVYPADVVIEPPGARPPSSARNRLAAEVVSVTELGNRARIGLATPQPLTADIAAASLHRLRLTAGERVTASWKAAATRLTAR